ncbi:POK8 protein, partial [Mionectes macconnelli]|nr:POK8 protein [Mionectes macconnelli]
ISHVTGIPHSPTDQAIIERAHGVLKSILQKQKGGEELASPHDRLAKALYVLNFLRLTGDRADPPIVIHNTSLQSGLVNQQAAIKVQYKDPQTGVWTGP